MDRAGDDDFRPTLADALGKKHRLAQGRRTVVKRRVGDIESGEKALMGLIFEDRLQRALRDLGLIRRVRRQKLGAQQKLIDAGRLVVSIGACPEERDVVESRLIAGGEGAEPAPRFDFRPWAGEVEKA